MVWLWSRIFGKPEQVEQEQRAERQAREPVKEVATGPPPKRCKACGYQGLEGYCPDCLADTMVAVRQRKKKGGTVGRK